MSEIRQAIPYVSRLKFTVRPTTRFDPVRELEDGRQVMQRNLDIPGILLGVTPIIPVGPNQPPIEAGDELFYEFKSRVFWQNGLAELKAIEQPTTTQTLQIANIEKLIAEYPYWQEDLLQSVNLTDLESRWAAAFSDSLDEFQEWREPTTPIGGLPIRIPQIRWDVRFPLEGPKAVEVTIGLYTREDLSGQPKQRTLLFEDGETRRNRERQRDNTLAAIVATTNRRNSLIAIKDLKAQTPSPQVSEALSQYSPEYVNHPDLDSLINQETASLDNLKASEAAMRKQNFGMLAKLIAHESVKSTVKDVCIGAFAKIKAVDPWWAGLDIELVKNLFAIPKVD